MTPATRTTLVVDVPQKEKKYYQQLSTNMASRLANELDCVKHFKFYLVSSMNK